MVVPAGAGSWPQITSTRLRSALQKMIGTSPPSPFWLGSITCSVKAAALAASKALPPFSRLAMATEAAIQCVVETTPKVPLISGRVVNIGKADPRVSARLAGRGRHYSGGGGRRQPQHLMQRRGLFVIIPRRL